MKKIIDLEYDPKPYQGIVSFFGNEDIEEKEIFFEKDPPTEFTFGSLSCRSRVMIDGERFFVKFPYDSDNCPEASSRNIQGNEKSSQEFIVAGVEKIRSGKIEVDDDIKDFVNSFFNVGSFPTNYRGTVFVNGVTGLLFKEIVGLKNRPETLKDLLSIPDYEKSVRTFDQDGVRIEQDNLTEDDLASKEAIKVCDVRANNRSLVLEQIINISVQVCQQANFYHNLKIENIGLGLIHRDITPDNILIFEDGTYHLEDFGIAAAKNEDPKFLFNKATSGGFGGGSYYGNVAGVLRNEFYFAPGLESYEMAEPSIDTYNISNILFLMITGRLIESFYGDEVIVKMKKGNVSLEELSQELGDKRKEIREHLLNEIEGYEKKINYGSGFSEEGGMKEKLCDIIMKGTSVLKEDRYQTASELLGDLNDLGFSYVYEDQVVELPLWVDHNPEVPEELIDYSLRFQPTGKDMDLFTDLEANFPPVEYGDYEEPNLNNGSDNNSSLDKTLLEDVRKVNRAQLHYSSVQKEIRARQNSLDVKVRKLKNFCFYTAMVLGLSLPVIVVYGSGKVKSIMSSSSEIYNDNFNDNKEDEIIDLKDDGGQPTTSQGVNVPENNTCGSETVLSFFNKPKDWSVYSCEKKPNGNIRDSGCFFNFHYSTEEIASENGLEHGCPENTYCCPSLKD